MSFLSSRSLAVVLALHEVVASALSETLESPMSCQNCEEFAESHALSLLQIRANATGTAQLAEASQSAFVSNTMKGMYPFYHTTAEIRDEVQKLAQGCGGALTVKTTSESGVDIDLIHVRAPNSSAVNRVFLLFGEHSRELISPESGLHFLQLLCGKARLGERDDGLTVADVLRDNEFQMVLNGNPRSRDRVESGEYCLRTNPSGVDLNRNWDEMWDRSLDTETNSGPSPFSEPETRIFKDFVTKFRPTTFLTVHSGTKGLYMPYAYDLQHQAQFNSALMMDVLKYLDKGHCECPFGAAGKEVGYSCPGTCLDWVYNEMRTPYVFAFEIYVSPDRDADLKRRWEEKVQSGAMMLLESGQHLGHEHFADVFSNATSDFVQRSNVEELSDESRDACFELFNPNTEEKYQATVQNWAVAYLEMSAKIAADLKKDANKELLDQMWKP